MFAHARKFDQLLLGKWAHAPLPIEDRTWENEGWNVALPSPFASFSPGGGGGEGTATLG